MKTRFYFPMIISLLVISVSLLNLLLAETATIRLVILQNR